MLTHLESPIFRFLFSDDCRNSDTTLLEDPPRQQPISGSWENLTLTKSRSPDIRNKDVTNEKIEIIEEEEIPPDDLSAEAVAKSLLRVRRFVVYHDPFKINPETLK